MTHLSAIAISICLLAQPAGEADPFKPRVVPSKRPAAAIEIEPRQVLPAETADGSQPTPAEPALAEPPAATPEPQSGPDAPAHEAAPDGSLAPLGNVPPQRLRPPELIAEALTTPREGALVGQPLDLLTAISRSADRQQQLRIANTYWKLSAAQARYHWALAGQALVDSATAAHANAPEAASARAAASADLRNAQIAVAEAQQELGDLVGMSGENQPLTVDRPHVGSYATVYEEIFGVRPAPPRIRLIHRTLPLRRKAIDAHGEAIVASLDALESARDELQSGRQSLAGMLNGLEQVQRERQAFLATVLEYNREIAEYLFSVARPGTSDQVLVSRLILTGPKPGTRLDGPPVRRPSTPGAPTLADPAAARQLPAGAEHLSRYRAEVTEGSADDRGVYGGLADLSPPARVQKLSELMHWDRSTAVNEGVHEAPLADALRGANPAARLAIVISYWQARQAAAYCQVLSDQVEQLNGLARLARANHDQDHVAAAAVQVQAARRVAKAALAEAQLALVQGEFDLTQAAGRSLDQPWLHAVTPPQSGRYIVARDDRLSGPALQWARIVKVQHVALQERADAVLAADDRRALAGAAVRDAAGSTVADSTPLSNLLAAVNWQTRQSLAFLDDLTGYNLAIVRYVMATSPPSMDSDELVRWLVIPRTARGET